MSSKTFLTISKAECATVYKDVLENSDKKWEGSRALANVSDYGGATSYAIISIEEMMKAILLSFDGNGFKFRQVRGMQSLFHHHYIRYLLAYAMFVINVFGDDLKILLSTFRNDPEGLEKLMMDIMNNDATVNRSLNRYAVTKMWQLTEEFKWFAKLDVFRQEGFYVDYEEQLKTPIKISEEDYNGLVERLGKVRALGKSLIETLWSSEPLYTDHFKKLSKNLIEKGAYQQMGEGLVRLNQTRENPFDVIKSHFSRTIHK